jgi:hypothetical protein
MQGNNSHSNNIKPDKRIPLPSWTIFQENCILFHIYWIDMFLRLL